MLALSPMNALETPIGIPSFLRPLQPVLILGGYGTTLSTLLTQLLLLTLITQCDGSTEML